MPSGPAWRTGPMVRMKSPALGVLDLDDLGAHLAQQPGTERRADAGAHVDDPQAGQGRLGGAASPARPALNGLPGSRGGGVP